MAAKEIDPTGVHVAYIAGDISDRRTAKRFIGKGLLSFGLIDTFELQRHSTIELAFDKK